MSQFKIIVSKKPAYLKKAAIAPTKMIPAVSNKRAAHVIISPAGGMELRELSWSELIIFLL